MIIPSYQQPTSKIKYSGSGWVIQLERYLSRINHQSFRTNWIQKDSISPTLPFVERQADVIILQLGDFRGYVFEVSNLLGLIRGNNLSGTVDSYQFTFVVISVPCDRDLIGLDGFKLATQYGIRHKGIFISRQHTHYFCETTFERVTFHETTKHCQECRI